MTRPPRSQRAVPARSASPAAAGSASGQRCIQQCRRLRAGPWRTGPSRRWWERAVEAGASSEPAELEQFIRTRLPTERQGRTRRAPPIPGRCVSCAARPTGLWGRIPSTSINHQGTARRRPARHRSTRCSPGSQRGATAALPTWSPTRNWSACPSQCSGRTAPHASVQRLTQTKAKRQAGLRRPVMGQVSEFDVFSVHAVVSGARAPAPAGFLVGLSAAAVAVHLAWPRR